MFLLSLAPSQDSSCSVLPESILAIQENECNERHIAFSSLHIGDLACEEHNGWWKILYSSRITSVSLYKNQKIRERCLF